MLEIFIGGIILFLVGVVQSALVTRIVLLNGMADLIMVVLIAWSLQKSVKYVSVWLLIGCGISALASELPFLGGTLAYACITTITILARNRFS